MLFLKETTSLQNEVSVDLMDDFNECLDISDALSSLTEFSLTEDFRVHQETSVLREEGQGEKADEKEKGFLSKVWDKIKEIAKKVWRMILKTIAYVKQKISKFIAWIKGEKKEKIQIDKNDLEMSKELQKIVDDELNRFDRMVQELVGKPENGDEIIKVGEVEVIEAEHKTQAVKKKWKTKPEEIIDVEPTVVSGAYQEAMKKLERLQQNVENLEKNIERMESGGQSSTRAIRAYQHSLKRAQNDVRRQLEVIESLKPKA